MKTTSASVSAARLDGAPTLSQYAGGVKKILPAVPAQVKNLWHRAFL